MSSFFIRPGVIEGFSGPMASGKSSHLLKRIDPLRWISGVDYIGFKPEVDIRDRDSRSVENFISWNRVPEKNPRQILDCINEKHDLITIDEIQFFDKGIVDVVLELQYNMKNVIFAGLDSDFRGEPFGAMKDLMFYANELTKLYAICPACGDKAYYSQRLIDGKPAHYDSPIVSIEGSDADESYEPRCFRHHNVPGKR